MGIQPIAEFVDVLPVHGLFGLTLRKILGFNTNTPIKRDQRTTGIGSFLSAIDHVVEIFHHVGNRYLASIVRHPTVRVLRSLEVLAIESIVQPLAQAALNGPEVGAEIVHAVDQDRCARIARLDIDVRMGFLWTVRHQ
ncbi:hypothetical protein WL35_15780 [Burkholderia ubonensis]|nr:hypothetical protein WJ94_30085 [Burkholderia ubonensis]KVR50020.1 hypothetical protein WK19_25965 [Burkholderia ubonensis]KVR54367.1 hypothetical protein WK18_31390 [Burkholderia ubonensis]KVU45528.1 hypothetical protein WK66_15565 [Burkholderia ubonensis]KVX24381.1 hypothetical protein WL03_30420 [Burkholderia ubonensis]